MLSHGFIQIPLPLFRRVAIFLVFLSFYVGLSFYFLMPKSQGAREATAHIVTEVPHKPIVFTALTRASMQYYLERENFQGQLISYPQRCAALRQSSPRIYCPIRRPEARGIEHTRNHQ